MSSDKESDQAKEERLREKLRRKAEELKSKEETAKGSSALSSKKGEKEGDKSNRSNVSSSSSPSRSRDRRRNNRQQRPDHQGYMDNRSYGRHEPPPGGHGYGHGNGPYRGDFYGRDRRRDFQPQYDHRRNGYGWHNGGYEHERPIDMYRRDDFYRHDRDRFGRQSQSPRNRDSVASNGGSNGSNRDEGAHMHRERGRSRSRSFSRSRSRSSDRSYSSSYGSRSSSRSNSRSSSRSRNSSSDRSHSRSASRSRSNSRSSSSKRRISKRSRSDSHGSEVSDKKERKKNRSHSNDSNNNENDPLTKDQRTIFVSQLVMKAGERELHRYFRKSAGCKVNDVQLLRDKRTGRHKGCAYVELGRVEDVPRAVAVSGKIPEFQRFPILVKGSEAEKNYGVDGAPVVEVPYSGLTKRVEAQKVYVGSIDCNVTQAQLYAIFSQFGNLEKVVLQVHPNSGMSKGFAFLSFKDPKVANLAIQAMSGQVLAGRPLRTGWANLNTSVPNLEEVSSSEFPDDAVARIAKVNEVFKRLNTTGLAPLPSFTLIPGMGLNDKNNLIQSLNEPPTAAASNSAIASAAEEALNAAFAMTSSVNPVPKLDENTAEAATTITEKPLPTIETPALPPSNVTSNDPKKVSGELSNIILVRNMFDKDEETDDGWEEDIKLDFEEESSKHGKILSVKVISKEVGGKIYASFETVEGAKACAENLAGRWFDKRQLQVEFVTEKAFDSL